MINKKSELLVFETVKQSDLRKIVNEYKQIKNKITTSKGKNEDKLHERLVVLQQRYYHETGITLEEFLNSS